MEKLNLAWLRAAVIRAIKTFAQTAIGMITVGAAISEVNWGYIASVCVVSFIVSILTSVAGLPETTTNGVLKYEESASAKDEDVFYVEPGVDFNPKDGDIVSFKVKK